MKALYSQRSEMEPLPYTICKKTNQSLSKTLKIVGFPGGPGDKQYICQCRRCNTVENIEVHNSAFIDDFLSMTQKTQVRKEKIENFTLSNFNFFASKRLLIEANSSPRNWIKYLQIYLKRN